MSEIEFYRDSSKGIVNLILSELDYVPGFSHWWFNLEGEDTGDLIVSTLEDKIYAYLVECC